MDSIGVSPFSLIYCHDTILPIEERYRSHSVAKQYGIAEDDYVKTMHLDTGALDENCLRSLE